MRWKPNLLSLVTVLMIGVVAGCSSGRVSMDAYNEDRQRFRPAANAVAKRVLSRIGAAGIVCEKTQVEAFEVLVSTYTQQKLPLPLGSASCVGPSEENLLVEVFGSGYPNAETFMTRKRELICKKAKELGRQPDGSSGFEGLPYVMAADKTWVVEPDSFAVNRQIAKALGRPARDACSGIK